MVNEEWNFKAIFVCRCLITSEVEHLLASH